MTYSAINGLTFQLGDDYTYLRTPEQATFFNEALEGSFEGIGAQVSEAEGGGVRASSSRLRVSQPGRPACVAATSSWPSMAPTCPP